MLLTKLVKYNNGLYYVGGGLRVQENSTHPNYIRVHKNDDSLVKCMFTAFENLPKVILTYVNYTLFANDIDIYLKWVFQTNVNIYIGIFDGNVDLSKTIEVKTFMTSARFVNKHLNVNHQNIYKLKTNLDVVYFSIDEYDKCFIREVEEDSHHHSASFQLALYITPTNLDLKEAEILKIITVRRLVN